MGTFMKKQNRTRARTKENLSKSQQRVLVRIVFGVILLGLVYTLFAPETGLVSYFMKRARLENAKQKTALLKKENTELEKDIDHLLHDPVYLEEVARKEYGLLRENETVYDFSPEPSQKKQ